METLKELEKRLCEGECTQDVPLFNATMEIAHQLARLNSILGTAHPKKMSAMEYADKLLNGETPDIPTEKREIAALAQVVADHVAQRQHELATTSQLDALQKIADKEE
jgi:hypothetical protein